MRSRSNNLLNLSGAVTLVGMGMVLLFTYLSGLQYRRQEEQGLDPGLTPEWIVRGTGVGLVLFFVGLFTLLVVGVFKLRTGPKKR
jgi:uncharacterized membrane protein YidH (DUF202 family)